MHRILLVEDSPTQAYAVQKILESKGFEVIIAKDGDEGVACAFNQSPDLVIMDVVMPGTSGFHATRRITKNKSTENIPVLMLTSKNQVADKLWAFRQGALGYLVKPVQEPELLQTVNNLLDISAKVDSDEDALESC